ncbi:MAG: DUF2791 family P-loop domain-containing protein [Candidatus Bathyarchaeia archaeon]
MSADFTITVRRKAEEYAIYKLRSNPFPASPVPEESPRIFADQENAKRQILESISNSVYSEDRRPSHLLIVGGYGNGKSHALKVIRTSILDQLYPENIAVAGYTSARGWSLLTIYQGFMHDLGMEFFEELKLKILQLTSQTQKENYSAIRALMTSLFLNEMQADDKIAAQKSLQKFLFSTISDSDLVSALMNMFYSEEGLRIGYEWICGKWIDLFTLRKCGITSRLDSDEKALAVIVNFRKLLESIGFRMLFICIDEVEKITLFPAEQRVNFLDSIRHIMDWNPTGLTLILSCSPEALELIAKYEPLERISLRVFLEELSEENLSTYVEAYINSYRTEKFEDPLFPFSKEILVKMFRLLEERKRANIRNFLKICHYSIEEGLTMKKERIDDEVVDRLGQRTDIYLGI